MDTRWILKRISIGALHTTITTINEAITSLTTSFAGGAILEGIGVDSEHPAAINITTSMIMSATGGAVTGGLEGMIRSINVENPIPVLARLGFNNIFNNHDTNSNYNFFSVRQIINVLVGYGILKAAANVTIPGGTVVSNAAIGSITFSLAFAIYNYCCNYNNNYPQAVNQQVSLANRNEETQVRRPTV